MSQYKVIIKEEAQADLKNLLRYEPKAYKKAIRFIGELYDHPKTGLGLDVLSAYGHYDDK
jgi:toxin YoeB